MLDKLQKRGKCLSFKGEASRQIFVEKRVGRGTIYVISSIALKDSKQSLPLGSAEL